MKNVQSLNHTAWDCKSHLVRIPIAHIAQGKIFLQIQPSLHRPNEGDVGCPNLVRFSFIWVRIRGTLLFSFSLIYGFDHDVIKVVIFDTALRFP